MSEIENKRAEVIRYNGAKYVRIHPEDIDFSQMTLVKKVTDVYAAQIKRGKVKIVTKIGKEIQTINYAKTGDWVIYDIGSSDFRKITDKLLNCEKSVITKENFSYLYRLSDDGMAVPAEGIIKLVEDLLFDNDDNNEFDSSFTHDLKRYKYIGKPVYAGYVPFNFVLRAPWGEDQFIKRGGFVIFDTNFERNRALKVFESDKERKAYQRENKLDFYGLDGAQHRVPGIFEKTYSLAPGTEEKLIADTFKMAIQADKSPIAGIQFNNRDLAHAYERAGKNIPGFLQKFLD